LRVSLPKKEIVKLEWKMCVALLDQSVVSYEARMLGVEHHVTNHS